MQKFAARIIVTLAGLISALVFIQPAQAQLSQPTLAVGCNWFLVFGPDQQGGGNTAFPDSDAYYWIALITENAGAGTTLRMDGRYDASRYFSFEIHDGSLQELDAIADFAIQPIVAGKNPFVGPSDIAPGIPFESNYTAYTIFGTSIPANRAPNSIYRPAPGVLADTTKSRSALVYRSYLRTGSTDISSLPILTLMQADGTSVALADTPDTANCATLQPSYIKQGAAITGSANLVDPTPPGLLPKFKKYSGGALGAVPPTQGTIGYNPDNGFLYVKTDQALADLLLVRGLAPTYSTENGVSQEANVRYWSMCQNDFNTQEVLACTPDIDAVLDSEGYYNFVVGQQSSQPALAQPGSGFNFLPWGSPEIGDVILRYLLQDPNFMQGIDQVAAMGDPASAMGPYAPLATYCSDTVFSANAAAGPAATFAACVASRNLSSPPTTGSTGSTTSSTSSNNSGSAGSVNLWLLAVLGLLSAFRYLRRPR